MKKHFLILFALILAPFPARASGTVYYTEGTVVIQRAGASSWDPLAKGSEVRTGDTVATKNGSRAFLMLESNNSVRLDANTSLTIQPAGKSWLERLKMGAGRIWVEVTRWGRVDSQLEV